MTARNDTPAYRIYVITILVLVYTFNFIDRQIVGILAVPIKADLGLSDTQLGLVGGLAFAIFYTALGIPIAVLADRGSRTWILTLALAVWSAMTAVCGLAQNFWQLFLARVGVGIGEAGGVAPAYSLISDYFPPSRRARALGAYSFGIPIGSALGIVLGGWIATEVDWRYAFFVVGVAGLLIAPVFKLTVAEPGRGRYDHVVTAGDVSFRRILGVLRQKRSFWIMSAAAASASIMGYGLFFWLPSFFVRSLDMSLLDASLCYGAILFTGGITGIWLGGVAADRLGARDKRAYGTVPGLAFACTVPLYAAAILSSSPALTFALIFVPTALGLAWLGPVLSAVQHLVRADMRATASAIFLFIINLVGIGLGTVLIGALSDHLQNRFGDDGLRYAILSGTVFYLFASLLFLLSAKWLPRDWETLQDEAPSSQREADGAGR